MLKIENLKVSVGERLVLKGLNLEVKEGNVVALMGPNGSGKTTLIMTIMGFPRYKIVDGAIYYKGIDIRDMPVYERVKLGIGLAFQKPQTIDGITLYSFLEGIAKNMSRNVDIYALSQEVGMKEFLTRFVNKGFSGGEAKRCELLQLLVLDPDLLLLDEPESGVDLDNIKVIGKAINKILRREGIPSSVRGTSDCDVKSANKSAIVVTHTGHILEHVKADIGYVLLDGRIVCRGNPYEILKVIEKYGYRECEKCL